MAGGSTTVGRVCVRRSRGMCAGLVPSPKQSLDQEAPSLLGFENLEASFLELM